MKYLIIYYVCLLYTSGEDIAKEHEKYITEYFNGPVFITDWPKDIKAYYMKLNPDGKTVAAVDLVVPQAGELMGGSQREENLDKLIERMDQLGVDKAVSYTHLKRIYKRKILIWKKKCI